MFTTKTEFWTVLFHDKFTLYHIQLTIYIKKINLLLTNSICLVFSSLKYQRRLLHIKIHCKFFTVWKETNHKPSNVATAKNVLSSAYVICTICFDKCFYIMWQLENKVLLKAIFISRIFLTAMLLLSLKQVIWQNFPFHFLSPE